LKGTVRGLQNFGLCPVKFRTDVLSVFFIAAVLAALAVCLVAGAMVVFGIAVIASVLRGDVASLPRTPVTGV
jgi:hypothetical protein